MRGVITYLFGAGRSNEHTDPHLVAGDPALLAWYSDNQLSEANVADISAHLDRPQKVFDTHVQGGHVWHCSLSLSAVEGTLEDEKWAQIATQFIELMGFDDAEGTKAPARWVAVRHGVSKEGNDHIHLAVNLVREDGTKASVHNDFRRARDACRELEKRHGLMQLSGPPRGRSSRGYQRGELLAEAARCARGQFEANRRNGTETREWKDVPKDVRDQLIKANFPAVAPRVNLARRVRGCATASLDEAEFVRRLRREGLLVRVRVAEGAPEVVVGYSVAFPPPHGQRPIWYSGHRLAHDLSVDRLRLEWPDTPMGASNAAKEWQAAHRQQRIVAPGREMQKVDPSVFTQIDRELAHVRKVLASVPVEDRETWARVARHTAGAFAAWSAQVEPTPGPLAAASDVLARSAELRYGTRPKTTPGPSFARAAMLMASAASGNTYAIQVMMIRSLANLAKALHDMHVADRDLQRSTQISDAVKTHLAQFAKTIPDPPKPNPVMTAAPGVEAQTTRAGSVLPNVLTPHKDKARATAARGVERD